MVVIQVEVKTYIISNPFSCGLLKSLYVWRLNVGGGFGREWSETVQIGEVEEQATALSASPATAPATSPATAPVKSPAAAPATSPSKAPATSLATATATSPATAPATSPALALAIHSRP